ncbi:MAG: restriction endonuclease subunit M [Chloroflexi bacterium]|nr:restriction endonuclease subunit M [Chloroflexota bacterium]
MPVPEEVLRLVARFDEQREAYHAGRYNEAQLRQEFLEPFFEALGWDVRNRQGYAEAYKDVIHEDAIRVGGATKAPDYCFRIGGTRKFFVEAKKPAVKVKEDISAAYQLRRYAWSAKLPLSILSDFEEFAVYDCRIKPDRADKAAIARTMYLTYTNYPQRWDEIAAIFSREAILKGSFDRYAESTKLKKGTAEVDDAFLQEIESWREALAHNLALRNPGLTTRQLNFAVQHTIDRVIFLRICEDRGIELYGRLMALQNADQVYARLCQLFREADDRYNSGLFHFRPEKGRTEAPDELSLNLMLDDKLLKEIIKSLYYPDSPYEFSVLPADILGQVYEQFLGKVIRLTPGHRAVVEDKPEVKKAGGVYYTPTYIVEYIVKNTVGRLVGAIPGGRPMTPRQVARLRILDPACGSGSFLIGAYQYLLDWHRDWYVADDPKKWATGKSPALYQTPTLPSPYEGEGRGGGWRLTTAERKRILLNNIYGVDIDPQAVEVTKLSLLLKVLEGENEQTLATQLRLFHERALPDLGNNIKCGNSLIGPDFYESQQISFLDEEERYRINVFDWQAEFPEVMRDGGFDAVIGNPPYGPVIPGLQQKYFADEYQHQDYYLLFLERYERLVKYSGLLGVIVSNTWLQSVTLRKIRQYLTTHYRWLRILHLPEKVFRAVVDTHVLIFQRANLERREAGFLAVDIRREGEIKPWHTLPWQDIPWNGDPINVVAPIEAQILFRKIQGGSSPLLRVCSVYNGIKPFEKGKGNPPQTEQTMQEKPYVREGAAPDITWSPLLRGELIRRYENLWNHDYWVLYGPWLAAPRDPSIFDAPIKIMVRQTGDSIIATLVERGFIARNNLHILLPLDPDHDLRYVLGIMNSRLIDFAYTFMNPEKGEALAEVKKHHVEQLPIRTINFSDPADKARHDRIVSLVEQMLSLHKQLAAAKTPDAKTVLQRQIEATDKQIDRLVYELYGLTAEEIAVVEERSQN